MIFGDAVGPAQPARYQGIAGPIDYFLKTPPVHNTDDNARDMVEGLIDGEGKTGCRGRSGIWGLEG